jgi:hypothetical protein
VARRTRQLPELSVGVGLVAFALAQVSAMLWEALGASMSPGASQALRGFTLVSFSIVSVALSLFTVETFGRTAWRWAVAASIVAAGIGLRIAMFAYETSSAGAGAPHQGLRSLAAATFAAGFLWMGIEALHYHGKALRAYRIGLARPEVVTRFLVLGVGGLASGALAAGAAVAGVAGDSFAGLRWLCITAGGFVNAVTWLLTFMPPQAYRRFVEARAARAEASHG